MSIFRRESVAVPRCEKCVFWVEDNTAGHPAAMFGGTGSGVGACTLSLIENPLAFGEGNVGMLTRSHFGCVQFEAK
jgi:hypothetical protein